MKRYIVLLLMALGAFAAQNEKVKTVIDFAIEIVKNLPEDLFDKSSKPGN